MYVRTYVKIRAQSWTCGDSYQRPSQICLKISTGVSLANKASGQHQAANYPRRSCSAIGVDIVLTLDVCMFVCMLAL